jgi:hypothetical protein
MMYDLVGSYIYHNDIIVKAKAKPSYEQVDYQNSGTMDKIDDFMANISAIGGYDFKLTASLIITPCIGFGYLYLRDASSNRMTSDGPWGYLREANYLYSPVEVNLTHDLSKKTGLPD